MPTSWATLFDRAERHDVNLEAVLTASERDISDADEGESGGEQEGDDERTGDDGRTDGGEQAGGDERDDPEGSSRV